MRMEASGGILLVLATVLAMVLANSGFGPLYNAFLETKGAIQIGNLEIAKPLLLWINDGLMAVFFFLVGLEMKREFVVGELSSPARVARAGIAAIGGVAVPGVDLLLQSTAIRPITSTAGPFRPPPTSPLPLRCFRCWATGCRFR